MLIKPCRRDFYLLLITLFVLLQGFRFMGEDSSYLQNPSPGSKNHLSQLIPISVDLVNCPAWGRCDTRPKLAFTLHPPAGSQAKYAIHVRIGAIESVFDDLSVVMQMPLTSKEGVKITYWVRSAAGVESKRHSFYMRCLATDGVGGKYLFQLLGRQWEEAAPGCATVWNIFPEIAIEESGWAQRIDLPEKINTSISYALLAGKLIMHGYVNASNCEDGGLLLNGAASACGVTEAADQVTTWQNEHNRFIQEAGLNAYIPARLLKGLIAQETQFWPHWIRRDEYGLGMLTELGVDMALKWNYGFFMEKCQPIYGRDYCSQGYVFISNRAREYMRGMVMREIGTGEEYHILAETLYASCAQSAQLVRNITKKEAREVTTYTTMWRITLGVYHSGCGCLYNAIFQAWKNTKGLQWPDISRHLSGVCRGAADYFDKVIRYGTTQ